MCGLTWRICHFLVLTCLVRLAAGGPTAGVALVFVLFLYLFCSITVSVGNDEIMCDVLFVFSKHL
jgi:hypothetical protein